VNEELDVALQAANTAPGGMLARVRRLTGALLQHLATRGELLAAELAEEKQRVVMVFVAAGIIVFAAAMVFIFAGVLALVLAWDTTHRNTVAWLLPIVFLVIAGGAFFWLKSLMSRKTSLFRDSLRELRQDAQALRS
jgi:uncharacterized membrane protein YqjE